MQIRTQRTIVRLSKDRIRQTLFTLHTILYLLYTYLSRHTHTMLLEESTRIALVSAHCDEWLIAHHHMDALRTELLLQVSQQQKLGVDGRNDHPHLVLLACFQQLSRILRSRHPWNLERSIAHIAHRSHLRGHIRDKHFRFREEAVQCFLEILCQCHTLTGTGYKNVMFHITYYVFN